jgi:acyl-CoA hydrolase/ribosomal protein S18 acetylase RimI-like enzyme
MAEASDWQRSYPGKSTDLQSAVRAIHPGRRILIGSGAAEPMLLVDALVQHGGHLIDNEIVHLLTLGPAPYVRPEFSHQFRHIAFFIGANVRDAVQDGRADFLPVFLSEIPELIRSRRVRVDVALVQVSPPDRHGYVSLGVSVDIVRAAVNAAELVIAQVNRNMPRTHGDSFVPVSLIDHLVPGDAPLLELIAEPPGPVECEIGRHVATLVPDAATIQTGIGAIPNAVLGQLRDRKDLGVHTEMLSDGLMELALSGAITGKAKTVLPGKMVTSFVMGSRALYEWVHDNPAIELRASDFTNDPWTIARNDRMVAINSALAVDLTGQVAADTLSGKFFSGIGGQVDFVRGAARSRGGRSIIALPSTARAGTISRIQAMLDPGTGVVTSRGDVRYVVTEYGIADLWGKNIRERATALIAIAHPDFRRELIDAGKQRRYLFPDQVVPRAIYPWQEERSVSLPGGEPLLIRPVRITDEQALQAHLYSLSDDSAYRRYLGFKKAHPHEEMQHLVDVDYHDSMALVALDERDQIVGLTRYDLDHATGLAEVAFSVPDAWQGRGVGTALLRRIAEVAYARGISGFFADVLASNTPMLRVFQRSGHRVSSDLDHGIYAVELLFDPDKLGERGLEPSPLQPSRRPAPR